MKPNYDTIAFKDAAAWQRWLKQYGSSTDGIWMNIYKKASGVESINYAQALDEALCYGWIDGQKKGFDELSFLQKFTPRRAKSLWSKRNIEHVARLEAAGLMMAAGWMEVERAQADGRWAAAYDAPSAMTVPEEFLRELEKHPAAQQLFATLNKTNTYAIAWRLRTAKTEETRKRRQDKLLAMLDAGQKLY